MAKKKKKSNVLVELQKIANDLDREGFSNLADKIDAVIVSLGQEVDGSLVEILVAEMEMFGKFRTDIHATVPGKYLETKAFSQPSNSPEVKQYVQSLQKKYPQSKTKYTKNGKEVQPQQQAQQPPQQTQQQQ